MRIRTSIGLGLYLVAFGGCTEVQGDYGVTAHVRVAHLSPDAPAVDFCLAPAGSGTFTGPVLSGAGGLAGISYGKVTRYLEVAALQYDVRLVAPASSDCATPLGGLPDFTNLPALPEGGAVTIAATGKVSHDPAAPFELRAYVDRTEAPEGKTMLRFIHASPGTPNVDVGIGGGAAFTPVFADVAYGGFQAHEDGYVTTDPAAGLEISARATGETSDVLAIKPVKLAEDAIATAFAIGELGNADAPLRVLLCQDSAPPHAIETECAIVGGDPERARVRIAHLSPDAPAVDVCLTTTGTFGEPLLASLGQRAGLAYPQVTEYVELPIATYDVRVIAATEATCANPAVPDTLGVALAPGLTATVAAIGDLDRSGDAIADPGFRLEVFADADDVAPGKAKLRFIHASPGTPNVDVGLGSAHGFLRLFGNVEFGKIAVHGGIDAFGYLEADPFTSVVSARVTGTTTDALVVNGVTLEAGQIATAFAIGNKTGSSVNPLRVLLCQDRTRTGTLLASCVVAP